MDEGDGAGRYWVGMCMIPFRNSSSMACLTQTLLHDAVTFLLMIAGVGPI